MVCGQDEDLPAEEEEPLEGEEEVEEEPPPEPLEKLVFIESHVDGVSGVDGLDGTYDMKLSSDGAFLYVASMNDDAISIFSRDKETGELNFVSRTKNGENGVDGLNGARSLDLSPDGKNLYAVSMFDDALVSFSRDEFSGALTYEGRIKDGEFGVDGLDGARSIAISPDGVNLYVAGWDDDALALFSRDPSSGLVGFLGRVKNGEDGISALDAPHFLTVAPDGKNIYVALWDEDAVSIYNRDLDTGLLTYNSKIVNDGRDAVDGVVSGLQGPRSALASPDGKQVYVVAWNDDALTAFNRDETGALEFVSTQRTGVGGVEGLDGAHSIAMSADGKFLYVAAFFDDAITVFSRDVETGELLYDQSIFNKEEGVEGLNGTLTIMASPDGEHVYSTSISEKSLVAFRREIIIDPPVFTVEPVSKSIPANSSVSLNALAEGIEVLYQWKADGIDVAGANDPTLVIDPVAFGLDGTVYTVEASNDGGAVMSTDAVLTVLPEVTLEMPVGLTALTQSSSTGLIEWQDINENETGFAVERKVAGGEYEAITQLFANSSEYTDTGLSPGTEYIYRIRATRPGEVSEWSNEAVIESFDESPNGPSELMVVLAAYNRIELKWADRSAVEDGYHVERQDITSGGGYVTIGTLEKSVTNYLDRGVSPENQYSYRVRAYNESGLSPYSNAALGQTIEIPVDSISPTSRTVAANESLGNFVGVVSSSNWEAIPDVDWLIVQTPTNGSGTGNEGVSYRVLENMAIEERIGSIDIGGQIHMVTQEKASEVLIVSPSDSSVATSGGRISLTVTANIPWTATSNSGWIEIAEGTKGENKGTIELEISANSVISERIGQVWVNDVAHTVTQNAFQYFTVASPTAQAIAGAEGEYQFQLDSNASWTLSESASWIEIVSAIGGEGDATVRFAATENTLGQPRSTVIRANEATHTVTQASANIEGEVPASPSGGIVDNTRTDGILITWTDSSDFELGFIIERTVRDQDAWSEIERVPANTTSYLDTDIELGVAYTYRVSAYNDDGVSGSILLESDGMVTTVASPAAQAIAGARGEFQFQLDSNESWVLSESASWLEIVSATSGEGDATVRFIATENILDEPRSTVISANEGTHTVTQASANVEGEAPASPGDGVADDTRADGVLITWTDNSDFELGFIIERTVRAQEAWLEMARVPEDTTSYLDTDAEPSVAYTYRVSAYNDEGISGSVLIDSNGVVARSRLVNLSTRAYVGTGDDLLISGFGVSGSGTIQLMARGVGPKLIENNVVNPLPDPSMRVHSYLIGSEIAQNKDWSEALSESELIDFEESTGAFDLSSSSKESVIVREYSAGLYASLLSDKEGDVGVALLEIYEIGTSENSDVRLTNLSSRGFVGDGNSVMIGGFVIVGEVEMKLLIRGLGPDLANRNVSGSLANPHLDLYVGNTVLQSNDDWDEGGAGEMLDAFSLVNTSPLPEGSKDSALIVTLGSGVYTVIMRGESGATGVGLLEIFVLE